MRESKTDLSFVKHERLRTLLEDYHREAEGCYEARCYLGALVACGAVLEGILTWVLLQHRDRAIHRFKEKYSGNRRALERSEQIERWDLSWLIDVACDLQLLGSTARDASWAVKDFRNFVHPYGIVDRSPRPNESLAVSALAAVDEILRSLRGRLA